MQAFMMANRRKYRWLSPIFSYNLVSFKGLQEVSWPYEASIPLGPMQNAAAALLWARPCAPYAPSCTTRQQRARAPGKGDGGARLRLHQGLGFTSHWPHDTSASSAFARERNSTCFEPSNVSSMEGNQWFTVGIKDLYGFD